MSADKSSSSLFYVDEHGNKQDDGLHDLEPTNPHAWHDANVQRAIDRGVSLEDAQRRYGYNPPAKSLDEIMKR